MDRVSRGWVLLPIRSVEIDSVVYTFGFFEDLIEQLAGMVKNAGRHGKTALFLIMTDSCLRSIQAKTKATRCRKSVNNAMVYYKKEIGKLARGYLKT